MRNDRPRNAPVMTDIIFSWTVDDIRNGYLFEKQVDKIPDTFPSANKYLGSFMVPLLEETRASLCSSLETISSSPFTEVKMSPTNEGNLYGIKVHGWRNESTDSDDPYRTLPGDILILANGKPETAGDLQRSGQRWTFAEVVGVVRENDDGVEYDYADDIPCTSFYVRAKSGDEYKMWKSVYAVYLINITTNRRIWNALHMSRNLDMINEVSSMSRMERTGCRFCLSGTGLSKSPNINRIRLDDMNKSQAETVNTILDTIECPHRSSVELIWGPPGTGKTKTTAVLLFNLLKMKKRTLVCAPTNVAIKEIASRVVMLVKNVQASLPRASQMLVFGNKQILHDTETEEIYLDYRVKQLAEFFAPSTGWRHRLSAMEVTLVECVSQYHKFLDSRNNNEVHGRPASFLEFFKDKFVTAAEPVKHCLLILYDHIPASYISEDVAQMAISLLTLCDTFGTMLCGEDLDPKKLEKAFSLAETDGSLLESAMDPILVRIYLKRWECISHLRVLVRSLSEITLPHFTSSELIAEFCYRTTLLLFCTCSSSFKLHNKVMDPFELLVIDEAAQLKECESVIPLQLPGIKHAILVGDDRQLTAMVESKISSSAGFGRSLFERLSSLGHPKHLLDTQYRMHPDISLFPTKHFYQNQILDATRVRDNTYRKCYLPDPMFGPFTFINVPDGCEEIGRDSRSLKNNVEAATVLSILRELHRATVQCKSEGDVSIGVISPYAAQVAAIKQKLGQTYDNTVGFVVKVKTVDGFQGGEEDIVIISCVRSNARGSIGFLADPRRTNVTLTRARYCLWILGNEKTLIRSNSVWEALVHNAKVRQCFFDVGSNKKLYKAIMDIKKENDQLDDLLRGDSMLFQSARWKILFSNNFLVSFRKLSSLGMKVSVLNFLLRLCSGWRPKKINVNIACERSGHVVQKYKVENSYVLCSIDIVKEVRYTQVLKVWDVLALEFVAMAVKRLDSIFAAYTEEFIGHCNQKFLQGDLEVPRLWDFPYGLIRERRLDVQAENSSDDNASNDKLYVENEKVSESLLLMKFYSLTEDVVGYLLSNSEDSELSLPFELTTQEQEIVMFPKTSFILGRSGTGKTTVLTMKLFLKEKQFREAMYGSSAYHNETGRDSNRDPEEERDRTLHQLFVTVSPKLCIAIKKHVSQLQSFALGGKFQAERCSVKNEPDDATLFKGIPNNFTDVSPDSYPLVITFHKLLMMLDGTVGDSYFNRFPDLSELCGGKYSSSGALGLQSLIRAKEVNYDKFLAVYWPHFNDKLTRRLDPSRVFTEIISHVKGGDRSGDSCVGILSRAAYVSLSESRASTLSVKQRAKIYDIFEDYEKLKIENKEFDLADFVNDIHCRLRREAFKVNKVDFVYIDEVQDLTMRQLSLFKYMCRNVEEGFVFSGDTAQTIARGIDFRFEDIRSLFYKDFLNRSREIQETKTEKGQLSKSFHLNQNFRTHDGILKLAQSIVDLLYHYFPLAVDVLSPEMSQICGEAPVLLESKNDENAIMSIFGNNNKPNRTFVGFGAEQVILVRDDHARNQVLDVVRGRALVLTIVECKGLEFQDVLLFDFFSTSPLKNRWRVIYQYMKDRDLLESNFLGSSPSFNEEKHDILCSELKQLYVAVTRTRQRLWICENCSDSSQPIFDYWKRLCLVQTRVVDHDLAEAMQVASTPEQWKFQGLKLLQEGNYPMASLCFERSGYVYGEKLAKASSLKSDADLKHALSPQEALSLRRQAAEIFEAIGESQSAAECYNMIEEYEKAGIIYMEERLYAQAGDCFHRGGCYALAADAYASGNVFSTCLLVCSEGKLFEVGLWHIESWRSQGLMKTEDMQNLEMDFLEKAALHYHSHNDNNSMMTYVRAFHSIGAMREFLKNTGCLNDLICLEVEQGNILEAATIARMKGDVLLEADLLGKGNYFKRASMLILGYVLSNSLWGYGSKGWPLKAVLEMEQPIQKARELAKSDSDALYHYVTLESSILLRKNHSLVEIQNNLGASKACANVTGEVLCIRSILDLHFCANASKFQWADDSDVEELISTNHMSGETLFYFWSCWKDLVMKIIRCIQSSESQEISEEERSYWMFCLDYLGVREEHKIPQSPYSLLHENAGWCRNINKNCSRASLASAAEGYWCGELMSVGMEVLNKLDAIYQFVIRNPALNFRQSKCLIRIYEAACFLLETDFSRKCSFHERNTLQRYIRTSSKEYFARVFPNGWLPMTKDMISLRESEASNALLERNFIIDGSLKNPIRMSNGHMGRIAMAILGSGCLRKEFKVFIGENVGADSACGGLIKHLTENVVRRPTMPLIWTLYRALEETYKIDWRNERDYMTPICFMYLLERLLILASCAEEHFFAAKSSVVEFLIYHQGEFDLGAVPMEHLGSCLRFISQATLELLGDPIGLQEWTKRSNLNLKEYFQKFMLKLVILVCILYLNFGENSGALFRWLDVKWISEQLPSEFGHFLLRFLSVNSRKAKAGILAEQLRKISDTLVLVSRRYDCSGLVHSDAIYLDTRVNKTKDDMVNVLFPESNDDVVRESSDDIAEAQKQSVANKEGVVTKEVEFDEDKPEDHVQDGEGPSASRENDRKKLEAREKGCKNKFKGKKKKGGRKG